MKRICVYCGSSDGNNPAYQEQARELGRKMGEQGIGLVYGGASIGLMGTVADAVLAGDGEVHGVIPETLVKKEVAHRGLTRLHVTRTMHERKALMASLSDAFIALPGGFGTFEELFETITWLQLGIHQSPLVVLNSDGYYDPLITFIDQAVDHGFIKVANRPLFHTASTVDECLEGLFEYFETESQH